MSEPALEVQGEAGTQQEPQRAELLRRSDGTWLPGKSGNNLGRPKKIRPAYRDILHNKCSANDWSTICGEAVELAKAGDAAARAWLSKYLIPNPSKTPEKVLTDFERLLSGFSLSDLRDLDATEAVEKTTGELDSPTDSVDFGKAPGGGTMPVSHSGYPQPPQASHESKTIENPQNFPTPKNVEVPEGDVEKSSGTVESGEEP